MEMVKNDPKLRMYFPEEYFEHKTADRTYLMNVFNTTHCEYLSGLIQHASNMRFGRNHESDKTQKILATDAWVAELTVMPFYSSKTIPN